MSDATRLEAVDGFTYKMPDGAHMDDDGMLRDAHGNLLPDGLYIQEDGTSLLYEGNFPSRIIPD